MAGQHVNRAAFAAKLWERVVQMISWTFVATYVGSIPLSAGQHLFGGSVADLSVTQRLLVSVLAGVIQAVVGKAVAPHVGDPNTPDLIPRVLLKRFGVPDALDEPLEVTLHDVIEAAAEAVKLKPAESVTVQDIAKVLVDRAQKPPPAV